MTIPYLALVVVSVCAVAFYRMGRFERSSASLWAMLSVAVSILALRFLGWGLGGVFLGQLLLFAGITLHRMRRTR